MKRIKKFNETKKDEKVKDQEVLFNAETLVDKDEKPSFKTDVEDQEEIKKEFDKLRGKVEKFENFTISIKVENDELENEIESEYEEDPGCGCCSDCTGQPGCHCGCDDCKCDSMGKEPPQVLPASQFISNVVSESLKYHLDNNKPITENIYRPGSEAFLSVIKEARQMFDLNKIQLCDIDREIFESTQIGNFAYFKGELVPLDLPMETIVDINEAEYKGKEVKLNYPMRGGSKKYYVYVKNPKSGNVKKISFGDVHGGLTAKVSNPKARKAFAARHQCSMKKDKTKAGYWACRINKYGHLWGGKTYPGYW